jgi:thioredoxin reductase (NADPH)
MQNVERGVQPISDKVTALERGEDDLWVVKAGSASYAARNVVVATGARLKKLGLPGEEEMFGQGVSECADCDGPFYTGQEAVVAGGGDSACQESLILARFAAKVTMVIDGPGLSARPEWRQRVAAEPKIVLRPNSKIVALDGEAGALKSVQVETAGQGVSQLPCAGLFVFIGLEPNTDFLPAEVKRDGRGAVIVNEDCGTGLPGLWAIGAVRSGVGALLTDAAADAERAVSAFAPARVAEVV